MLKKKETLKFVKKWSSRCGAVEMNLTRNNEVVGLIPGLTQWVQDLALPWTGSDLVLLLLWHRPAATALIRPLAWEPPYAVGVALRKTKKKKKKERKKKEKETFQYIFFF